MKKQNVLIIVGQDCIKDNDGDYNHYDVDHIVAVGTVEALEAENKRYQEVYDRIIEAYEEMEAQDVEDYERSPDYQNNAYSNASNHDDINGVFVAELFWDSWGDDFHNFNSRIIEVPVLE